MIAYQVWVAFIHLPIICSAALVRSTSLVFPHFARSSISRIELTPADTHKVLMPHLLAILRRPINCILSTVPDAVSCVLGPGSFFLCMIGLISNPLHLRSTLSVRCTPADDHRWMVKPHMSTDRARASRRAPPRRRLHPFV